MSLLEQEVVLTKVEITPEQIAKGIEVISPLFDREIILETCELKALHGCINGIKRTDDDDRQLRYDIVLSNDRRKQGRSVNERHLGLFVIRKMLLDVDLINL